MNQSSALNGGKTNTNTETNTITILPFKANTMLAIEPRSFSNAKLHLAYSHRDACAGYEAQESFLRLRELLVFNSCFVLC